MIPLLGYAEDIPTDIDDEEVYDKVTNWIDECQKLHSRCPQGPSLPPRRLLDIDSSKHEAGVLRLVDDLRELVKYVAISHCWGTGQHFTTTRENLQERKAGIKYDDLPQTFQDAVIVTKELGLRYLWIDSLCIIQDDM